MAEVAVKGAARVRTAEELERIAEVWKRLLPIVLRPMEGCKHCRAGVPLPHDHE